MKKNLKVELKQEVLSLITGITYANVPFWYGSTRRDLKMDLIVPKHLEGHRPLPVMLWICGGAFLVNDKSVWMPEMLRFAREGFVVASVEYRTSNDAPFPAALEDVKASIRYLRAHAAQYCIDPEHIFVMGESAGGALASLVGTTGNQKEYDQGDFLEYDSSVSGVVDFYGCVDMRGMECINMEGTGVPSYCIEAFLGWGNAKETEKKASAVLQVSEQTPPFMILHGEKDPLVPLSQSEGFYEALKANGIPVEYYILEGAIHGDDLFYQDEIIHLILDFFRRNMK